MAQSIILAIIFLNVIAVALESEHTLALRLGRVFSTFDLVSLTLFTIEYCIRLWTCVEENKWSHPLWGRLRFARTPFALVDLLAVAPFFLPMIFTFDLRIMRALRLLRVFRILKLGRHSEAMQTLTRVARNKREELTISLLVVFILLVVSSTAMYYVERDSQPQLFSSIPAAMWWTTITLTTVGYGDAYPVTAAGRVIGAVVAIFGIALFALPTAILASGFIDELQLAKGRVDICPHCGKELR